MDYATQQRYGGQALKDPREYGNQPPPNGTASLPMALDEQLSEVRQLHETVAEVEKRLMFVLGPAAPEPTSANGPAPENPHLVDRVTMHTCAIRAARSRLADLLGRLQL